MLSSIMFSENVTGHSPVHFLSVNVIVFGIKRFELRQLVNTGTKIQTPFYTVGVLKIVLYRKGTEKGKTLLERV